MSSSDSSDSSDSDSDVGYNRNLHKNDIRSIVLSGEQKIANGTLDDWEEFIANKIRIAGEILLNIYIPTSLYNKIIKGAKDIIGRKSKKNKQKFPYSFFLSDTVDRHDDAQIKVRELRDHFTSQFQNYFLKRGIGINLVVEHKICEELGITSVYGLGDKVQSSSWLINN